MLEVWQRLTPLLLDEKVEDALGLLAPALSFKWHDVVAALDELPGCTLEDADKALDGLLSSDVATREAADGAAALVLERRAPIVAAALDGACTAQAVDDELRNLGSWRERYALVEGTTSPVLELAVSEVTKRGDVFSRWLEVRALHLGRSFSERRGETHVEGLPVSLRSAAVEVADLLGVYVPEHSRLVRNLPKLCVAGRDTACFVRNGKLVIEVRYTPTLRSLLAVAHEFGHGLHALASSETSPPGVFVGETVACLSALVCGDELLERLLCDGDEEAAGLAAITIGSDMCDGIYVSNAMSRFEDLVHTKAMKGEKLDVSFLNKAFLGEYKKLYEPVVRVPDTVRSGWARLPDLIDRPGHGISYVLANLLALAIAERGPEAPAAVYELLSSGGIGFDAALDVLGFTAASFVEQGLEALERRVNELSILASGAGSASN